MIYMTDEYRARAALFSWPLTHSRILWDNRLADAAFAATNEREGFEAERAQTPDTVSWWWPEAAGTLTATLLAPAEIDGIGIAAHTIGSSGATITVSGLIDGDWVQLHDPISPTDDEPLMIAFRSADVAAVRVALSASARVGVLYAGAMLAVAHQPTVDAPPLSLIRSTTYETNRSQTGQFMGRSEVRSSRPVSVTWPFLRRSWYREHFEPFARAARKAPFFVAIRPGYYPDDVGYVLTSEDMNPIPAGRPHDLSVTLNGEAHVGPEK